MEWDNLELKQPVWQENRHGEKSEKALVIERCDNYKVTLKEDMEQQKVKEAAYHLEKCVKRRGH